MHSQERLGPLIALLLILACPATLSQTTLQDQPRFDLSRIEGLCTSKGRLQDKGYNNLSVIDQIVAGGKDSIPILIELLTSEKRTKRSVICYWNYTTVGDIAFIALTDLFLEPTWDKATIPGVGWGELLGRKDPDATAEQHFRDYVAKHGRESLQAKWRVIWEQYKDKIEWDKQARCFRLRNPPTP